MSVVSLQADAGTCAIKLVLRSGPRSLFLPDVRLLPHLVIRVPCAAGPSSLPLVQPRTLVILSTEDLASYHRARDTAAADQSAPSPRQLNPQPVPGPSRHPTESSIDPAGHQGSIAPVRICSQVPALARIPPIAALSPPYLGPRRLRPPLASRPFEAKLIGAMKSHRRRTRHGISRDLAGSKPSGGPNESSQGGGWGGGKCGGVLKFQD